MRTIILVALLLSCKQTTSAPHQKIARTEKFVKIDKNENKILIVDADGKKFPVAVHHVRGKNSYEDVKQMSEFGNKFVSPDRLLRWEKMVLTYQANGKEYTCVVSPAAAKSFHDDASDEEQVEIDGMTCETDDKLYVFARLCLANHGKIITADDLTAGTSDYSGYYIELLSRNFACVIKRGGKEIPLPSYCFIDEYQVGNTMFSVFQDDLPAYSTNVPRRVIDEHVIEAAFRRIVPLTSYAPLSSGRMKNCRYGKKLGNNQKIGYQYEVGESEELEEIE